MLTPIIRGCEPWFLAAEICLAIGVKNSRQAVKNADLESYQISVITNDGKRKTIVSESGMLEIISNSKKAQAKEFRKLYFREYLPALRQRAFNEDIESRQITLIGQSMARTLVKK